MVLSRAHLPSLTIVAAMVGGGCETSPYTSPVVPDGGAELEPFPDGGFTRPVPGRLSSVIVADRPPPPISGGTLAITKDGKTAIAADPDRDAVYVVDLTTQAARTISLSEGSEPGRVAIDASGNAHVALRGTGKVAHVDVLGGTLLKQTEVCEHPRGIAHEAADDTLWLACAGGELIHLSATHDELSRTQLALDLRDVVITKDGQRFVSRFRSAELLRVGPEGTLATTLPMQRFDLGVSRSPVLAWRTIADVTGTPLMLHQHAQDDEVVIQQGGYGSGCQAITQSALTSFDAQGTATKDNPVNGAALSVDVAMSGDGLLLAVATPGAYLRGERGSLQLIPAHLLRTATVSDVVSVHFSNPWSFTDPGLLDGGVPLDMRDAGAVLGLAAPLTKDAGFTPVDAGARSPCSFASASDAPDVQVTSVAFSSTGALIAFSREPASLAVYSITYEPETIGQHAMAELTATISLSDKSVRDTGHELFHGDVGSGLACASCHGEALDDGHVWTFAGIGPRRTQNMRGGLLSTLPLHWEGDMQTFQHLTEEVLTNRMGGFKLEKDFSDALANWIDVQPALHLSSGDAASVSRGKALFESSNVGCATCHDGAVLTNNLTVDVGTGGLFQVPSLLGLGLRAPFMHDGCAKTLAQRFDPECGGGDQHGKTSHLTADEVRDLTAYLLTL